MANGGDSEKLAFFCQTLKSMASSNRGTEVAPGEHAKVDESFSSMFKHQEFGMKHFWMKLLDGKGTRDEESCLD